MHISLIDVDERTAENLASLREDLGGLDAYHDRLVAHAIEVNRYYNLREYLYTGSTEKFSIWRSPYPHQETVYVRDTVPELEVVCVPEPY